jgi:hypothetical protein
VEAEETTTSRGKKPSHMYQIIIYPNDHHLGRHIWP